LLPGYSGWLNAGIAQYLNLAMPWSSWSIDKVSLTDIAFHALAAWVLDVDILGNQSPETMGRERQASGNV
jgi:hypothetical protein